MRIIDLLKPEAITLGLDISTKSDAINALVGLHAAAGNLKDKDAYKEAILAREEQGTTAIGDGIAVPHAKTSAVKAPALSAITVPGGVDYGAPDGKPSDLLFMIAATEDGDVHLEILSRLMVMLMDADFAAALRAAKTPQEFLDIINKQEAVKYPDEVPADKPEKAEGYRILAVTACPTGIAHTYMAAEALEKAGEKLGYPLKAETDGSGGVKNRLTKKEIEECDGIIVAADKNVEMARFEGKKVLKVSVSSGINKPEELINKIMSGNVPVYHHDGASDSAEAYSEEKESFGRKVYKHLMNGVSHMLPFVVGGGVLIALGFLIDTIAGTPAGPTLGYTNPVAAIIFWIGKAAFALMLPVLSAYIASSIADRPGLLPGFIGGVFASSGYTFQSLIENQNLVGDDTAVSGFLGALIAGFAAGLIMLLLKKIFSFLPKSMDGIKPVFIYPLLGTLLMGLLMCLINPIVGLLNTALSNGLTALGETSRILLSIVLAAMMAIDMGGPFNKAAYVFGTAMITDATTANDWTMAAVLIGGMVPPIAIALATTFFKNRWTEEELKSGSVNYIMGLCFITEGAIPYAAADPLRVIPSCIVGSGVAGAISALFNCSLPAPHGGIFVFPVVDNVLGYIVALVAGSVVGCLMLALLKKKRTPADK
ncbi:MAG TPA: fructose-specific PTS transporter subunit EIIC [Candidatus Eubacterium faecipullorum]|uniref:Fructose-specific PTS transporter subunit EIIC n=1 Tax=Candidatus Eubacterium faecipullorum TaxID=2838571 RepID=A0A9D1RE48_9FIRM|nr:fructose-specific PTS transporter subunit EIIC [Candidatus Eubacterium faecipullorum]